MKEKAYIVRCTVTADVVEVWRAMAGSTSEAVDIVSGYTSGNYEFLRETVVGGEESRRDFEAVLESEDEDVQIQTGRSDRMAALVAQVARMTTSDEDGASDHESVEVLDSLILSARDLALYDGN